MYTHKIGRDVTQNYKTYVPLLVGSRTCARLNAELDWGAKKFEFVLWVNYWYWEYKITKGHTLQYINPMYVFIFLESEQISSPYCLVGSATQRCTCTSWREKIGIPPYNRIILTSINLLELNSKKLTKYIWDFTITRLYILYASFLSFLYYTFTRTKWNVRLGFNSCVSKYFHPKIYTHIWMNKMGDWVLGKPGPKPKQAQSRRTGIYYKSWGGNSVMEKHGETWRKF